MDYYSNYYEARQHLNLSDLAFEIIEYDKSVFLERASRQGIINMILRSYVDNADASIDTATERYREYLLSRLLALPDEEKKTEIVATLVDSYRQKLVQTATHYPKGHAFKIQLDKANYDAMLEWRDNGDYYKGIPGRFLKAVIEEYARKTQFEREGILLQDSIEELQSCIDAQQLVVITLSNPNHTRYEVRPYSICCDAGSNYHYFVGIARKAGTTNPDRVASFRISRISKIRRSHLRSGKITALQIRDIEHKLRNVGVQFLLQDPETVCVKLTEQGKKMYDSQVHLRPLFTRCEKLPDGSWNYSFECTKMQAEFYFFKFGADAIIESPIELREKFMNKYKDAIEHYESKNGAE